jgi:hypothetical protein
MRNKSFLGVTLHFLEENEIYNATLGVYELEERHTADYIAESWEKVCALRKAQKKANQENLLTY